jgi:hypothetical protein
MGVLTIGLAVALFAAPSVAAESHRVKGYVTKSGTYVAPTRATNPNRTKVDNYSSKANVNPYSRRKANIDPYAPRARRAR